MTYLAKQRQTHNKLKKMFGMIPDSLASVVLFQGAEKNLKVQLDPTCQGQGNRKLKFFFFIRGW